MSEFDSPATNPFASPQAPGGDPYRQYQPFTGMNYSRAYGAMFENPNWMMLLLFLTLASMIPVVSVLLIAGYFFTMIDRCLRTNGPPPDFEWDDFVEYLMRGLWPFLIHLVVGFVVGLLPVAVIIGVMVVGMASPEMGIIVGPLMMLGVVVASLGVQFALTPMALRAGITQDFAEGFNFNFVVDFVSKVWLEMLLSFLFLGITAPIIGLVGLMACGLGVLPAAVLIQFAGYHLTYLQLYQLYLLRGGTPIPTASRGDKPRM